MIDSYGDYIKNKINNFKEYIILDLDESSDIDNKFILKKDDLKNNKKFLTFLLKKNDIRNSHIHSLALVCYYYLKNNNKKKLIPIFITDKNHELILENIEFETMIEISNNYMNLVLNEFMGLTEIFNFVEKIKSEKKKNQNLHYI
jgi:hypothetical protein